MEDLMKNFLDSAKDTAEKAGEKFNELKDVATEKAAALSSRAADAFSAVSEKAEAAAAEAKAEAAEKLAEAQAAKEKIAQHEGGALGFLTDKAKELVGEAKEEAAEVAEEAGDFWSKAKGFAGEKADDISSLFSGK